MLDTHTQDATRSAQTGYRDPVTPHTEAALSAIAEMADIEIQLDQARERRDAAVVKMHTDDGMRPPQIARLTGMSTSNVRRAIDLGTRR